MNSSFRSFFDWDLSQEDRDALTHVEHVHPSVCCSRFVMLTSQHQVSRVGVISRSDMINFDATTPSRRHLWCTLAVNTTSTRLRLTTKIANLYTVDNSYESATV